jgi:hypothetical protein
VAPKSLPASLLPTLTTALNTLPATPSSTAITCLCLQLAHALVQQAGTPLKDERQALQLMDFVGAAATAASRSGSSGGGVLLSPPAVAHASRLVAAGLLSARPAVQLQAARLALQLLRQASEAAAAAATGATNKSVGGGGGGGGGGGAPLLAALAGTVVRQLAAVNQNPALLAAQVRQSMRSVLKLGKWLLRFAEQAAFRVRCVRHVRHERVDCHPVPKSEPGSMQSTPAACTLITRALISIYRWSWAQRGSQACWQPCPQV